MKEVKSMIGKIVMGVCDHCRKKAESIKKPFCVCDEIVKKFISVNIDEKEELKKHLEIRLPTTLKKSQQINIRAYSDSHITQGLPSKPTSGREPDVEPMFYPETYKSDIHLNKGMRETDLKIGYEKQPVTFLEPIKPMGTPVDLTPYESVSETMVPGKLFADSDKTFPFSELPFKDNKQDLKTQRPALKDLKQENIFEDTPSMDAKEALKRRHDLSMRQMMSIDSGGPYSASRRPDVYETPKITPWEQKETKHHVSEIQPRSSRIVQSVARDSLYKSRKPDRDRHFTAEDLKIKRSVDKISPKAKKTVTQLAKSKSWHKKTHKLKETVENVIKPQYSFFFPEAKKIVESKMRLDVSSSQLIKDTKERFQLQAEKEKKRRDEKKLQAEEKKRLAAKGKQYTDTQKRRIEHDLYSEDDSESMLVGEEKRHLAKRYRSTEKSFERFGDRAKKDRKSKLEQRGTIDKEIDKTKTGTKLRPAQRDEIDVILEKSKKKSKPQKEDEIELLQRSKKDRSKSEKGYESDEQLQSTKKGRSKPGTESEIDELSQKAKKGRAKLGKESEIDEPWQKIKKGKSKPEKDSEFDELSPKPKRGGAKSEKESELDGLLSKTKKGRAKSEKESELDELSPKTKRGRAKSEKESELDELSPKTKKGRAKSEKESELDELSPKTKKGRAKSEKESELDELSPKTKKGRAKSEKESELDELSPKTKKGRAKSENESELDELSPKTKKGRAKREKESEIDELSPKTKKGRTKAEKESEIDESSPKTKKGRAKLEKESEIDELSPKTKKGRAKPGKESEIDELSPKTKKGRAKPEKGSEIDELQQKSKKDRSKLEDGDQIDKKMKKGVKEKSEPTEKGDYKETKQGKGDRTTKSKRKSTDDDALAMKMLQAQKGKRGTTDSDDAIMGKVGLKGKFTFKDKDETTKQSVKEKTDAAKSINAAKDKALLKEKNKELEKEQLKQKKEEERAEAIRRKKEGEELAERNKLLEHLRKEREATKKQDKTKPLMAAKDKKLEEKQKDIFSKQESEVPKLKADILREEILMKRKEQELQSQLAKQKEKDKPKEKEQPVELKMHDIKIEQGTNAEEQILGLVRIKQDATKGFPLFNVTMSTQHRLSHEKTLGSLYPIYLESELALISLDSQISQGMPPEIIPEIVIGEKILKTKPGFEKNKELEVDSKYRKVFLSDTVISPKEDEISQPAIEEGVKKSDLSSKKVEVDPGKGVLRYALSDRTFIEKGWTMLPTEKVVRKMNVYRMRPAHPEFDWFEHNKNKRLMTYDTGERLAEFDDNGRGRWYYRSGQLALDYYDAEETNVQQRFVVYSSGEPDERGRTHPITILATFDYQGNGIVFDHAGKIRLKYNQTEGVVLDRGIGPVSHWKWHTLNDPPVLQQVMIDTQMAHKDPNILRLGSQTDSKPRPENEEMLAIEFDNFIKEKSKKLSQSFKPFQIKMKALKINEHFSLKVLDQATVYLIFRDGSTNLKLNIGMILDHQEIVDTDTAEVGEVSNSLERFPARTDSLAGLQRSVAYAQRYERQRSNRERRLRPPEPCASADNLTAAASHPMRLPLRTVPTVSSTSTGYCSRKPANNLYYNTRLF